MQPAKQVDRIQICNKFRWLALSGLSLVLLFLIFKDLPLFCTLLV
jgi:hypothetical protein